MSPGPVGRRRGHGPPDRLRPHAGQGRPGGGGLRWLDRHLHRRAHRCGGGRHGRRGGGRAHGRPSSGRGTSGKGTGAAAAFVPAGASNSGFAASCARPKPLPAPSVQDLSVSYGGQVLPRWVCSSKRVAAATFLRSQGNRCRPVLILSFFCCSFLSGFLLYYGHRQKSTERNIRSCAVLPHCCLPR